MNKYWIHVSLGSALSLILISCKTGSSRPKSLVDAVSAPEEIMPGLYSVECGDGSTGYYSESDLAENGGEAVCRADRLIYTIQGTYVASESLNNKGNCFIPANTTVRLARPMSGPTPMNDAECDKWGYQWAGLQACRNFHVEFLSAETVKVKQDGPSGTESCRLTAGKIFGPMATTDEIKMLKDPSQRAKVKARFIYTDRQLSYPRLASYPSYPGQ